MVIRFCGGIYLTHVYIWIISESNVNEYQVRKIDKKEKEGKEASLLYTVFFFWQIPSRQCAN